jgi:type IV pilus assembly protein PilP
MIYRGRIRRITNVLILVLGMVFAFSGCEKPSAPPPITRTKPSKKKVQKPSPSKKANTRQKKPVFSYNPKGKVDPFKPFIQIGSPGKAVPGVPKTPLQEYDLSQLKLTAIVYVGNGDSFAMVEDSAGKGFTIKKGTYLGKRGGKVKAVHLDRVIIEEPSSLYGTQSKPREIVMRLPEEGGKK